MNRVVGIRWREADPIIFADAGDLELINKNCVAVRTEKGRELDQDPTESGRPVLQNSYPRADQGT